MGQFHFPFVMFYMSGLSPATTIMILLPTGPIRRDNNTKYNPCTGGNGSPPVWGFSIINGEIYE